MDPFLHRKPKKIRTRLTLTQEIQKGYKHLLVSLVILNIILATTYIALNSSKSTYGYTLARLEKQHRDLREEQKQTEKQLTKARAMSTIEKKLSENSAMEEIKEQIIYLGPPSPYAWK